MDILHEMVLMHNFKPYLKFRFALGPPAGFGAGAARSQTRLLLSEFLIFNKESPKFSDCFNIVDNDIVLLTRGRNEGE